MRLAIALVAMGSAALLVWGLDMVLKRLVLWALVLLVAVMGSG